MFEFFVTGVQPAPVSVGWAADSSSLSHPDSLRPGGFRVRGHHDCVAARAQRRPAASPARGPGCHAGWPPGVTVARGTVTSVARRGTSAGRARRRPAPAAIRRRRRSETQSVRASDTPRHIVTVRPHSGWRPGRASDRPGLRVRLKYSG